jgi:hypothetical protein
MLSLNDMVEAGGPHLSEQRIRYLANGNTRLQSAELRHFQECDQCSDKWWKLKQQKKPQNIDPEQEKSA